MSVLDNPLFTSAGVGLVTPKVVAVQVKAPAPPTPPAPPALSQEELATIERESYCEEIVKILYGVTSKRFLTYLIHKTTDYAVPQHDGDLFVRRGLWKAIVEMATYENLAGVTFKPKNNQHETQEWWVNRFWKTPEQACVEALRLFLRQTKKQEKFYKIYLIDGTDPETDVSKLDLCRLPYAAKTTWGEKPSVTF